MSTRNWRIIWGCLVMVGLCALVASVLVYPSYPREPSYQGKTLGAWIAPFCRQTPKGLDTPAGPAHFEELQPVRQAVAAMGTNAVPFLRARLTRKETGLHRWLRQLADKQPLAGLRLADPRVGRIRAIRALAVLGPGARPAIPDLVPQLAEPALAEHVTYALAAIGPEGSRALVNELTNSNPMVHMQAAWALVSAAPAPPRPGGSSGDSAENASPAEVTVEGLLRVAQDPSVGLRIPAINRLGMMGPGASNAVPGLLPMLDDQNPAVRHTVITALGMIRARPDLVIPALTDRLTDPDPGTRMAANSALIMLGHGPGLYPFGPNAGQLGGPMSQFGRTNAVGPAGGIIGPRPRGGYPQ